MKNYLRITGFTLVELLITLAILAIIFQIGAPAMTNMIANNKVDNTARRLSETFNYARSEAVTRGEVISVCASNTNAACSNDITHWNDKWLIVRPNDEVLRVEDVSGLSLTFTTTTTDTENNVSTVNTDTICFDRLGEECNGAQSFVDFTFSSNSQNAVLRLYRTGAVDIL